MTKWFSRKNAAATLEYVMLIVILIGAVIVSRDYISRAIFGKWKTSMDSLSSGRQYDPQKTLECAFDPATGIWYDIKCAEAIVCAPTDQPCLFDRVNQCSPKCIDNEHPPICSRRTQCDRTPPAECGEVPDNCDGPPLQCGDCPNSGDHCNLTTHRCECAPKTTCDTGDCGAGVSDHCGGTITCPDLCSPGICSNNRCCSFQLACNPEQCGDIPRECGMGDLPCENPCSAEQVCFNNQCCTPQSCQPGQCGDIPNNGCGRPLHCEDPCTALGQRCNSMNQCECIPKTCGPQDCEEIQDNCTGIPINCKSCTVGTCVDNKCCPLRTTCNPGECSGPDVPDPDDGCQGTLTCPTCLSPKKCVVNAFGLNECCALESDELFCSKLEIQCGEAMGTDNCWLPRTVPECGPCSGSQVSSISGQRNPCPPPPHSCSIVGQQCCAPESDEDICSKLGRECGPVTAADNFIDNCGWPRTIAECGPCTGSQVCSISGQLNPCPPPPQSCSIVGQQCCAPESDADFCSRAGIECGQASGTDNCGHPRTVAECGPCINPEVCSIEVPSLVVGQQCCTPDSEAAICSQLGRECGAVTAADNFIDNCGWPRTVADCETVLGACSASEPVCSIPDQQCCSPESDADICSRLGKECGPASDAGRILTDNCGHARTINSCGSCPPWEPNCQNGQCEQ